MSTKKMIFTKQTKELILREYSIRGNEFIQYGKDENTYKHTSIRGYLITIEQEIQNGDCTGRILVRHTDSRGYIKAIDTWQRTGDKAEFLFRDTPQTLKRKPEFEAYEGLQEFIEQLRRDGNAVLMDNQKLKSEIEALKQENEDLKKQLELAIGANRQKHPGGRPRTDKSIAEQIIEDCENGISKVEVAKKYGVGRRTVYTILEREGKTLKFKSVHDAAADCEIKEIPLRDILKKSSDVSK